MTAARAEDPFSQMLLDIADERWRDVLVGSEARAGEVARAALAGEGVCTLVLADDAALADLNQRFRGKAGPTNVLSFPAPEAARPFRGDVILALETVEREAREQGKSPVDHTLHLIVHGVLHLLGYDHMTESEADQMESREREILSQFGVADPYRGSAD